MLEKRKSIEINSISICSLLHVIWLPYHFSIILSLARLYLPSQCRAKLIACLIYIYEYISIWIYIYKYIYMNNLEIGHHTCHTTLSRLNRVVIGHADDILFKPWMYTALFGEFTHRDLNNVNWKKNVLASVCCQAIILANGDLQNRRQHASPRRNESTYPHITSNIYQMLMSITE